MPKTTEKTCPYCLKNFSKGFIQRHITACANKKANLNDSLLMNESDDSFIDYSENHSPDPSFESSTESDGIDDMPEPYVNSESESDGDAYDSGDDYIDEDLMNESDFEDMFEHFNQNDIENENREKSSSKLVTCVCLFLAYWQFTYNITDTALESLIKFLHALFTLLGTEAPNLETFVAAFPPSLYMFLKFLDLKKEHYSFKTYVVCIKCFKLYDYDECHVTIQGEKMSKSCNNILFPNHPQRFRRAACGQKLLMEVKSTNGSTFLKPFKTFCYMPLKDSLERLLKRKDIYEGCEHWKNRTPNDRFMSDIYDGRVWKENLEVLSQENTFSLAINLDWFCPYVHVRSYSVGAIYGVLLNLPRNERYLRKNIILIGIIPNMKKEPSTNTFIEPLVDELMQSWRGEMTMNTHLSQEIEVPVKIMLLLVGCDIPACRKLCGFLGKVL